MIHSGHIRAAQTVCLVLLTASHHFNVEWDEDVCIFSCSPVTLKHPSVWGDVWYYLDLKGRAADKSSCRLKSYFQVLVFPLNLSGITIILLFCNALCEISSYLLKKLGRQEALGGYLKKGQCGGIFGPKHVLGHPFDRIGWLKTEGKNIWSMRSCSNVNQPLQWV